VSQLYLIIVTMFLAIVDGDAVDLDLRISQPNVRDSKRDNPLTALQLTCDSPESSSTIPSQVNLLQDYTAVNRSNFSIYDFLLAVAIRYRQINLEMGATRLKLNYLQSLCNI
jgi:hypothetical protein